MAPDVARPELRAYILGTLDAARAETLEARYIADPVLVEEIRDAEDELVADYVSDRLTAVDRVRFESHYLSSPGHRGRVALARALADWQAAAAPRPAASPAFYGWMAMAAAVVLMSLWLTARPVPEPRQAQTPPPAPPTIAPLPAPPGPDAVPAPAPGPAPGPAPVPAPGPSAARPVFAITLPAFSARGGAPPTLHRPPAGLVDLAIRLEGTSEPGDRSYGAELQTVDGRVVWRGAGRPAPVGSGLLTTIRVPIEGLPPDDYVVMVSSAGAERGRYVLRLRGR